MDKIDTSLSRRKMMLIAGGAVAAAGALVAAPFRAQILEKGRELVTSTPLGRRMVSLADAGYEEWVAQVGSTFTLGGGASMRLSGVRAFAAAGTRPSGLGRSRAFVAFFDPPRGQSPAGDLIYTATHSQYGPMRIFLSAAGDPGAPSRMLAVFN